MSETMLEKKGKTKSNQKKPPRVTILVLNNDYTSFDVVITVLTEVFGKSEAEAIDIAYEANDNGKAVVMSGISRDVALLLLRMAMEASERYDHGRLKFKIKED